MKSLLAALLIVSGSAFSQEIDATEALLSILPPGEYRGTLADSSERCEVSVRNLSNRVAVVATKPGLTTRTEVYVGASYWRRSQREFLSSVLTTSLTGKRENFVRTVAVTEKTQYVVVGDIFISGDRSSISESVVECVVNL